MKNNTNLEDLLNNFFKYCNKNNYEKESFKDIDFKKIRISSFKNNLFFNLFSNFALKVEKIDTMLGFELSEKSSFILSLKKELKDEVFDEKTKLNIDIFSFDSTSRIVLDKTEILHNAFNEISKFENKTFDLFNSREYLIDYKYIHIFNDVLAILNSITLENIVIDFKIKMNGNIEVSIFKEEKEFRIILEANNIKQLYLILKDTNLNDFVTIAEKENISFSYIDNRLICNKNEITSLLKINGLFIKCDVESINYIIKNCSTKIGLQKYNFYLNNVLNIENLFLSSDKEQKADIFNSLFFASTNQDNSNSKLDEQEIANIYKTSKINIVETYKKKKPEQYNILRLGATCKSYGICEDDLIELINGLTLEKVEK